MSRGDWLKLAKVVGIGFGLIGVVLAVYFAGYGMGSAGGYFDAQADGYAAQYPADTDQRIKRCFSEAQPPRDTQSCVSEAVQTSHENQRTEQDLSAQRKSAEWARWIFITTLAQLPLTAVGLIFLLQTIWQGREALDHARAANRTQVRAYVSVPAPDLTISGSKPSFRLVVRNAGQTPAKRIRVEAWACVTPLEEKRALDCMKARYFFPPDLGFQETHPFRLAVGWETTPELMAEIMAGTAQLHLSGEVKYEDVFGEPDSFEFEFVRRLRCVGKGPFIMEPLTIKKRMMRQGQIKAD